MLASIYCFSLPLLVSCRQDTEGSMKPGKISIQKAALFGLFFGMAFAVINNFPAFGSAPSTYLVGLLIGGAVGGAFLFAVVAGTANLFRK